jgi:hypothetical protein
VSGVLDRQLRSRCLELIKSLPIPRPFDLERFRENLERHRGRPLLMIPAKTPPDCSGLWIGTRDADYILYERATTSLHQWHIVAHESGHMLLGHGGIPIADEEFARLLFPDLDPELVRSTLARSAYTDAKEREAETFATLLLHQVTVQQPPGLPPGQEQLLSRVEGAFTARSNR